MTSSSDTTEHVEEIKPYKLTEIFSLIPEFDRNQIILSAFVNSCGIARKMCTGDQHISVEST